MNNLYEETKQELEKLEIVQKGEFANFDISAGTLKTLERNQIQYLFPIQQNTFPEIFSERNVIARDRTGSGKTLAFVLPVLEKLRKSKKFSKRDCKNPLVICVVPTRKIGIVLV